ncbi:Auxilin-related protein 2 [Heracleum sosnowskyi]|uniref:Auxilin-related protein 2 n=1 Tax=Heracleum sosnowskyi TaxID=360622 RepID=A0AAD8MMH1_9APIA|nr:Auxilin-related protein 2 [Heracleum sosnowskyi]
MDESWRMPMGMSSTNPTLIPRRKSTEHASSKPFSGDPKPLDPEDFDDVFGGPPRTVLSRQFSRCDMQNLSYEHIFRRREKFVSPATTGRNLPEFRIPAAGGGRRGDEFYVDVFGNETEESRRCRSRSKSKTTNSKSNSSSVLSSEEFSPFRPMMTDEDAYFPVFASKLRPINVPSRWKTSTAMHKVVQQKQGMPDFSCSRPSVAENEHVESFKSSDFGFSRRVSSPETSNLGPNSYSSFKVSVNDLEVDSPSSVVSSLLQEQQYRTNKIQEEEGDDDEVMSSYVIELNADHKEQTEKVGGVAEAIEWAKGKFQSQSLLEDWGITQPEKQDFAEMPETPAVLPFTDAQLYGYASMGLQLKEMALLDEEIRLWSSGKKRNIQLLISTLHNILWPSSGWCPVPLAILSESSNLNKAYQKARLCLHPAKLQQRGASLPQKYIAEKALAILQDAWATCISQDINTARG